MRWPGLPPDLPRPRLELQQKHATPSGRWMGATELARRPRPPDGHSISTVTVMVEVLAPCHKGVSAYRP